LPTFILSRPVQNSYSSGALAGRYADTSAIYFAGLSLRYSVPDSEQWGGEPLPLDENDCWYWTSTEVEKQQTAKAWLYSMGSGAMQETPKVQAHKVRPIITINE